MKKIILIGMFLITSISVLAQTGPYRRVSFEANPEQIKQLLLSGVALDHISHSGNSFTGEFNNKEFEAIKTYSSKYKVLVNDVSKYYANRAQKSLKKKWRRSASTPVNFHLGSMAGFMTWQEMVAELDTMQKRFPSLITLKQTIGSTLQNRQVYYVKISDNPIQTENETEILYEGMHHAREPIAMTQMIYFMWYLLENYGTDPEVTYLVDNRELYFIPIVNPDGYVFNEMTNPFGGGMWRKNLRDNGDGTTGVDLNRNYDYDWGIDDFGSSPFGIDDTYRGSAPFSEPETQIIRGFINAHHFKTHFSYHSFHNVLIYPWGSQESVYTPDSALYDEYSANMTAENQYVPGTAFEVLGYVVNGGSIDWTYGNTTNHDKIISMVPEVGTFDDGFWPLPERIIPLSEETLKMNLLLAWYGGAYVRADAFPEQVYRSLNFSVPVQYAGLGLNEKVSMTSYLEFIEGNNYILSADTVKKDSIKTLNTYEDSIHIKLNADSVGANTFFKAVLHTRFGGYEVTDTMEFFYLEGLGISKQQKLFDFNISPNPANDVLNISFESESPVTMMLYTESGILITEKKLKGTESLSINGYRPGTYLIRLKSGNKFSKMKKLIVQR